MTGLENARWDLSDAQHSLETAIELLDGLATENQLPHEALHTLISNLKHVYGDLQESEAQLSSLEKFLH